MQATTHIALHPEHRLLIAQVVLLAAIVAVFLYATAQLVTPYIAHDDLNFLMPTSWTGGYATPWAATLSDGRWTNYLWYQVSTHLDPRGAYWLFAAAYFLLAGAIALNVTRSGAWLLCGLALFASPMFGELSLWPSALFSGTLLCALATWLIVRIDPRHLAILVLVATCILVLTYPPLAAIVLLVAAMRDTGGGYRRRLAIGAAYVAGFALGTLAIYSLNLAFHGDFGIRIATWRHPHPLRSLSDLPVNLHAYGTFWARLWRAWWGPLLCGALAAAMLLSGTANRRRAVNVLLATALVCAIELGITVITGIVIPVRAAVWLWLAICLLCGLAAITPGGARRHLGQALLLLLAVLGAMSWWTLYRQKQPTAAYAAHLAAQIREDQAHGSAAGVVTMGNPRAVAGLRGLFAPDPMPEFVMLMRTYGIRVEPCAIAFCERVQKHVASQPHGLLLAYGGKLVLVFDPHGYGVEIERNYPTAAAAAAMKLNYPLFLRQGNAAARITPFFPGTAGQAVSVRLAPAASGYTLSIPGAGCAFPVEYRLTDATGETLAHGTYRGPRAIALPQWGLRSGTAVLSIRMAPDARNNHGCNASVTRRPLQGPAARASHLDHADDPTR